MNADYIITSDCWIDRKPVSKGTVLTLDPDAPVEMQKIAELNHAGRIGLANKKNVDAIQGEIKAERERERKATELMERRPRVPALQPA